MNTATPIFCARGTKNTPLPMAGCISLIFLDVSTTEIALSMRYSASYIGNNIKAMISIPSYAIYIYIDININMLLDIYSRKYLVLYDSYIYEHIRNIGYQIFSKLYTYIYIRKYA